MEFSTDTYIVLDLPAAVADHVISLRKRLEFHFESIPAEITVTGSSGVGPVSQEQDPAVFVEALERIAALTAPVETRFKGINTFGDSGVYFLEPLDQAPFRALHQDFADSGLSFRACPFNYFAHCTIKNDHDRTIRNPESVLSMDFPTEAFTLEDLRVYSLAGVDCKMLYETTLAGRPGGADAGKGFR